MIDSAEDGISIILFCGYLVKQLEQAKALASKEDLIRRALDKDFVPNDQYAQLFLLEIPPRLRLEVFFGVYEKRAEWSIRPIYHFNKSIIEQLNAEDRAVVVETISNDLKTTDNELVIRHVMGGIPGEFWRDIADIARLRIENKVIGSIRDGKYDVKARRCLAGGLATWARSQFSHFLLKTELINAVAVKLATSDSQERNYALQYLSHNIFQSFELSDLGPIHRVFTRKLKDGVEAFYDDLVWASDDKWSSEMKSAFESFTAKPEFTLEEEIPF